MASSAASNINIPPDLPEPLTCSVLGIPVTTSPKSIVVAQCLAESADGHTVSVVTANPEIVMRCHDDPSFGALVCKSDWVIPDGAGVVWALRLLYGRNVVRMPGIELAEALVAKCAEQGGSVALVGGAAGVAELAASALKQHYPHITIAVVADGFGDLDAVQAEILAKRPRLVLAALGVPRQEFWLQALMAQWPVDAAYGCIGVGVGGSFDVWSGNKKRAPALFCKLHLEWLYRITSEPWRISRVARPLPLFVLRVLGQKFFGRS